MDTLDDVRFHLNTCGRRLAGAILGLTLAVVAHAADPVRGKQLFNDANGAPKSCATSGCHNGFPQIVQAGISKGKEPAVISAAIESNKGKMGFLSAYLNGADIADIAAYIANPSAGDGIPAIALSKSALSFASQVVDTTSATQTITVSNPGTAPLSMTVLGMSGNHAADFLRTGTCAQGVMVAAGASCTVHIAFRPQATGTRTATVVIDHNASAGRTSIGLTGTGAVAPAAASVSPTDLGFTQVVGSVSAARTVTLSNTGGQSLTINAVTLSGAQAAEFAVASGTTCSAGLSVASGASCLVKLTFAPTAIGARAGLLSIAHSAAGTAATVVLSGTGTTRAEPAISLSKNALTYSEQPLGVASNTQPVTVSNTGQADLMLSAMSLSGSGSADFVRGGTCAAGTLLPVGGSCAMALAFAPTAVGTRMATLTVSSNASNGNALLSLSGVGFDRTAQVTPSSATVQSTVGKWSPMIQTVLTNSGQSTLTITALSTVGPFTLQTGVNACAAVPFDLAPGQSCNVYVAFQSSVSGTYTGQLLIASNASNSPSNVALSAEAVAIQPSESGNVGYGGCSIGASNQLVDPILALMFAFALISLIRRRR